MFTAAASLAVPASAASSGTDAATGPREAIVTRDSAGTVTVMAPDARGNWTTVNSASELGLPPLGGGETEGCQEAVCTPPNGGGGTPYVPPNPLEPPAPAPAPAPAPLPPPCEPPFCNPPPPPCFNYFHQYFIYIPNGPTLVEWKFKENYCRDEIVVHSMVSTDDLRIYSPVIVQGGSRDKTVGPTPATVVRVVYDKKTFAYCPSTPILSNCSVNFNPVIDHYFLGNGQILNFSTL
jgi:hypothetical protein